MSFFGGSKKKGGGASSGSSGDASGDGAKGGGSYRRAKTGGEVDGVVAALLHHANDKEEHVRMQIHQSLRVLGVEQPELVVTSAVCFVHARARDKKLTQEHRVQCLKVIGTVLEAQREALSPPVAKDLAAFAARELVLSRDVKADWQGPASAILASLATPFPSLVIDELLGIWRPGAIPHYYVVKTLADVAAANGTALALRLQDVLSRAIPVLGSVQKEPMKWAFAAALGRFVEALAHFDANATPEEREQLSDGAFRAEFTSAFDVIYTNWLVSREPKVRFAVAESLGYMARRLAPESFDHNMQRLVATYLGMYRKEKADQHLAVSQGLTSLMRAAVELESPGLDAVLPQVLAGIHPMVAVQPDYRQPQTLKNHNELLRCFEVLAQARVDQVLTFVTNRFPTREPRSILGSLLVLRHLVNAMDEGLADRKPFIISSVQALTTEQDLTLRKNLLQLVVGMANQGYLQLEGGQELARFVVRQAAISDRQIEAWNARNKNGGGANAVSPQQIRTAANHILRVMATKVPETHAVLWPFLAELLALADYTPAIQVITRAIADICEHRAAQGEAVAIDFDRHPDIPAPPQILARLMVLVNVPHRHRGLGEALTDCMLAMSCVIHPAVHAYWQESVPALQAYLEAHPDEDSFQAAKWQDTLLKMFRETVAAVGPGSWLRDLAGALSDQYALYKGDAILVRAVHRYLGALCAHLSSREVVSQKLDLIMRTVDHRSDVERQGCAQGLGLAAAKHLDLVLPKITGRLQELSKPKKKGFFSFGSSAPDKALDPEKGTLVLCYGYTVAYADGALISSRLDAHVLPNLIETMDAAATADLRENCVKAVDLIGKAMHPSRLPNQDSRPFVLKRRDVLMQGVLRFLGRRPAKDAGKKDAKKKGGNDAADAAAAGDDDDGAAAVARDARRAAAAAAKAASASRLGAVPSTLLVLGLNALTTLAALPKPLGDQSRAMVIETALPALGLGAGGASAADEKKGGGPEHDDEVLELATTNVSALLSTMVHMQPTLPLLTWLLQRLEYYVVSRRAEERERAVAAYLVLLKKTVAMINQEGARPEAREFRHLGHYLATMLPRCADPDADIRATAAENVQALLYVDQLLRNPDDATPSQELKLLTGVRERLSDAEGVDERLAALRDLAGLLSSLLDPDELPHLLRALHSGLGDPEEDAARGAACVLVALTERRAAELGPHLEPQINGLVAALGSVPGGLDGAVASSALHTFRLLATAHFKETLEVLLAQPRPIDASVGAAFRSLADADEALAEATLKKLLGVLNDSPYLVDKPVPRVVVATAALGEILTLPEVLPLVNTAERYGPTLGTLLLRVGSANGVDDGSSSRDAVETLRAFCVATLGDELGDRVVAAVGASSEPREEDEKVAAARRAAEREARLALSGTKKEQRRKKKELKEEKKREKKMRKTLAGAGFEGAWSCMTSARLDDGVGVFVQEFAELVLDADDAVGADGEPCNAGGRDTKLALVRFLAGYLSERSFVGQRVAATAVLSQLVLHCNVGDGDGELLGELVGLLLPRVADPRDLVRRQSLRGLGNLEAAWTYDSNRGVVEQHASSVLAALTSAGEDKDAVVAGEAVSSMTRIARVVSAETILPMLISICYRMRPAFDRKEKRIRVASFHLFAELCRFGAEAGAHNFMDQVHSNMTILAVHMNDEDEDVREACHGAFQAVARLAGADMQECLEAAEPGPDTFEAFAASLAPILVALYPTRLGPYLDLACVYFKSKWGVVRGNAVIFAAHLLAATGDEQREQLNVASFVATITEMLKQDSGSVRAKTAKALSLLHHI